MKEDNIIEMEVEKEDMEQFTKVFASNTKIFLDNPNIRPSPSTEEGRGLSLEYVRLFTVLDELAKGNLIIQKVEK